jgi:hypothetical protein
VGLHILGSWGVHMELQLRVIFERVFVAMQAW